MAHVASEEAVEAAQFRGPGAAKVSPERTPPLLTGPMLSKDPTYCLKGEQM